MTYLSSMNIAFITGSNKFQPLILIQFILAIGLTCLLAACAANPEIEVPYDSNAQPPTPHKIAIVNASPNVINSIKYKPCGSQDNRYHFLTGNLRPNEKFSINIYSQCVDLRATNAFKKKLVDIKNIDLKKIKTWTIK